MPRPPRPRMPPSEGENMTLKKIAIGGGLGLCLLLGMLMYHNKLTRQEVLDVDLWKDSLCESKKQSGYPAKNFGVSL